MLVFCCHIKGIFLSFALFSAVFQLSWFCGLHFSRFILYKQQYPLKNNFTHSSLFRFCAFGVYFVIAVRVIQYPGYRRYKRRTQQHSQEWLLFSLMFFTDEKVSVIIGTSQMFTVHTTLLSVLFHAPILSDHAVATERVFLETQFPLGRPRCTHWHNFYCFRYLRFLIILQRFTYRRRLMFACTMTTWSAQGD